jgi:hypothetical protein
MTTAHAVHAAHATPDDEVTAQRQLTINAEYIANLARALSTTTRTAVVNVDGTVTPTGVPSRRSNKNNSGRRNLKQHRGRTALKAVGGYDVSHPGAMAACIAKPADTEMCLTYEQWAARNK